MSTSWISKKPLTVLLEKEFGKYWQIGISYWFKVTTGIKQGCVMSGFILIVVFDWVMRRTVPGRRTKWNTMGLQHRSRRSDISADDIALFSSTWSHMQRKTSRLEKNASYVGLKISAKNTKLMRINARRRDSIKISGSEIRY